MDKRVVIIGKAGSGKNHAVGLLREAGYLIDVGFTTRPKRKGEVSGEDYYFVTESQFDNVDYFFKATFNGWNYGISLMSWISNDVFILPPKAIEEVDRKTCTIIYLDIPLEIRKQRLSLRNDADQVIRRIEADEEDFKEFAEFDKRVTNENFTLKDLIDESKD